MLGDVPLSQAMGWSTQVAPCACGPGRALGPYTVEDLVARGGMGVVWRARSRATGELRAIKVLRPDLASNPGFIARFAREANLAASLQHPNVVRTYAPGVDAGATYIPMELLRGPTLEQRIRVRRCTLPEVVWTLTCVCSALQVIHDRGWVHRDIKPSNIVITDPSQGEVPKLVDFGTMRRASGSSETQHDLVVGSPCYMPPEQAVSPSDVDGRADQYAVGVLAYEMLTGRRPHVGRPQDVLRQLVLGSPPLPIRSADPEVHPGVARVVMRALSIRPDERFASVDEFADALWWAMDEAKQRRNVSV